MTPTSLRNGTTLTIMSLLALVLTTLHVSDDLARGISPANATNLYGVAVFAVWLFGTLVLANRRWGFVIMFVGGLFAAAMPVLHMRGMRYPAIATGPGGFFFVWTLFADGIAGTLAAVLALQALWRSRSDRTPPNAE